MMNENNFCIIMAGGFGGRFWPLCDEQNPKQFMDLMGNGKTMLQAAFDRYSKICPRQNIIVVTAKGYARQVREQLGQLLDYQVLEEPVRRNTAPCIAYAASVIAQINPNATIIVTPSDHAVLNDETLMQELQIATMVANQHDWIITLGTQPNNPNTKYGYIQFSENPSIDQYPSLHKVVTFTEKPPFEMAIQFIMSGEFLWNMGIFVWRLPVLIQAYRQYLPDIAQSVLQLGAEATEDQIQEVYGECRSISVDFGIIEKAENVHVLKTSTGWSDVETWELLYNTCPKDADNNAIISGQVLAYDVQNCIVNVPGIQQTLVLQGLDGYIVTASKEVLMICRRDQQDQLVRFSGDYNLLCSKKKKE